MSAGSSFSWRRPHIPWGAKKKSKESKLPEVSANLCLCNFIYTQLHPETGRKTCDRPSNNACWWGEMVDSCPAILWRPYRVQQWAENSQNAVPTKTDYAVATVKEVLTLAQSAASVIPVPLLKEAIGVALKIIQVCEVRWILILESCKTIWSIHPSGCIGSWTKSQRAAS